MNYLEAIKTRRSRRNFIDKKIDQTSVDKLLFSIEKYNQESQLNIQLILDNKEAFDGFRKNYGIFSGVKNYIALIGKKNDENRMEKEGYYGELLVLEAQTLGISSCWVGATYDKSSCECKINEDEFLDCVIAFGYSEENLSFKERFIHTLIHRKSKSINDLLQIDEENIPDWIEDGMKLVLLAPSSLNLQPVIFKYLNNELTAFVEGNAKFALTDLGIAKLHFELGAKKGKFNFGNFGNFIY